jgi:hypothetical protein
MEAPDQSFFSTWLAQHRRGELDAEIALALDDVTRAAQATGKPGSIQIVLTVKPNPHADSVILVDEIKVKTPQPDRPAAIYYVGDDGRLQRDDPTQTRFFDEQLRRADPETGEVRRVGDDS